MKCIVNALIIVALYYLSGCIDICGSNLSCSIMGYSRDQLFNIRDTCLKDSNSYISILKENGLFKFRGPRGTRAGQQVKDKSFKISTITSVAPCPSRRSVTHDISQSESNSNLIYVKQEKCIPQSTNPNLTLCLVNPCSISGPKGKTQDFLDYSLGIRSDITLITETFLTDRHDSTRAELHPPGYCFSDQPRLSGAARGGTGLFYRDCFDVSKSSYGQKQSFEYSEWIVKWSNKRLRVCIIYHPPYSQSNPIPNSVFLDEFKDYLESIVLSDELLCIAGDFNIHMNKATDPDQLRLTDILESCGLVNHIHFPTHKDGNTLDLIITRDNGELGISNSSSGYYISDHCFCYYKTEYSQT